MFERGCKNREKIIFQHRGCGVVIMPEPICKYPEGHPCHGCVFTFKTGQPSCLTGSYPDTENCINAFYKKMQTRHGAERERRLKRDGSENEERNR